MFSIAGIVLMQRSKIDNKFYTTLREVTDLYDAFAITGFIIVKLANTVIIIPGFNAVVNEDDSMQLRRVMMIYILE